MKTVIYLTFTILLCITTISSFSQILTDFPCYTISSGELPNVLFEYDATSNEWIEVGITGGTQIEAIATDPVTATIYATDKGTFGTIDANTGIFTPIGEVGIGNGDNGLVELNDIKGLTYDPINKIMYGTHRVDGYGIGTNDLLFQIDVATGNVLSGAMLDSDDNPADYAVIPEIFLSSWWRDLFQVEDIAYNTYTGQFFAIHTQLPYTTRRVVISQLNPLTGQILTAIYVTRTSLKSIGFNNFGELLTTIGDEDYKDNENSFFHFSFVSGCLSKLSLIDPTNQHTNFAAFDCFTAYNDLALKIEVDPNVPQPVNLDETVTFLITIYNQGQFLNSDVTITNYIPEGLILSDKDWINLENGTATYTINQSIEPGTSVEIPVSFIVDPNSNGASLTNTAEIKSSFNPDITDFNGNPIPLPDWDSKPDDENNETNVVDNELNGDGPNSINNKDEDDHDIAIIQVQQIPCPAYLTIPDEEISGYFQAQQEIDIQGYVKKSKTALFDICK